jgi:hypothetical protein
MAITYDFAVEFQGMDEVSSVKLKNNIIYLESLKFMVEYMYAQKYAKVVKINSLFNDESYINLAESVGFDDLKKKHHWRELLSDDDVQYLFRTIEDDPSQARLYATLSTV